VRIAVIGAGWSGLAIAQVLRDCGMQVSCYEHLDDVGGTWHRSLAYAGLKTDVPLYRCEFYNFPYPDRDRNRMERISAAQMFDYCQQYARDRDLYPLISFNTSVKSLHYSTETKTCYLDLILEDGSSSTVGPFDFVVSTQFNAPRLPKFTGQEQFSGQILHSNDVKETVVADAIANAKKVVLLGGSKAATDIAYYFTQQGCPFIWLMRSPYWFANYNKAFYDLKTKKLASYPLRYLHYLGMLAPLPSEWRLRVWRWVGLLHTPGTPQDDFTKFHLGWVDEEQIETLATQTHQVYDNISRLKQNSIVLDNGSEIPCDLLVCATGCNPLEPPIALFVDGEPIAYENITSVYRSSIIPEVPCLCFTGYFHLGVGPINGYHRAGWILRHLENPPSVEKMKAIADTESDDRPFFQKGPAAFDSSQNFLDRVRKAWLPFIEDGFLTRKDAQQFLKQLNVDFKLAPFSTVESFIESRRKPLCGIKN